MRITGISIDDYVAGDLKTRVPAAAPTATSAEGIATVSLSQDSVSFAINGESDNFKASNYLSLFSVLNANILDYSNLAGVGSAIDTYKASLASSHVYESSYTAPSAKYLADLSDLKTTAASGNQARSEALLAKAKFDAPDSVAGGIAMAESKGDGAGEAGLMVEGTANMSDFLATHGYSASGAATEAAAVTINGLALNAADTPTSSAQTRLQQISTLASYSVENHGRNQPGSSSSLSEPLFDIVSTLIKAQSGTAISQSLTKLEALYGVDTSGSPDINA